MVVVGSLATRHIRLNGIHAQVVDMRAVRAATSRGEDGHMGLGGSPKYVYTKARPRASSFDHQSSRSMKSPPHHSMSRPRLLLPPNRHVSVSRRHPTPTTKQKRVPKSSATKRSRVMVRVAAARGQVRHQHGIDSRFPMPYPEVDRDRRQPRALPVGSERQDHQYHYNYYNNSGERGALQRAGAGYPESRRVLSIDRSHGSVAASSRRRTRPRSAMVAPFSHTGSGSGQADRSSQLTVVSQFKRKQRIPNASTAEERNQRGGSKRPRYEVQYYTTKEHMLLMSTPVIHFVFVLQGAASTAYVIVVDSVCNTFYLCRLRLKSITTVVKDCCSFNRDLTKEECSRRTSGPSRLKSTSCVAKTKRGASWGRIIFFVTATMNNAMRQEWRKEIIKRRYVVQYTKVPFTQ